MLYRTVTRHFALSAKLLIILIATAYTVHAQKTSPSEYIAELKSAKSIKDTIYLYYNIGYWYSYEGSDSIGDIYTYKAIELSKQHNLLQNEAKGYYILAEKFFYLSNSDSAGYYAQKSINAYDKAGKKEVQYVYALSIQASIALEKAEADKAIQLTQRQMEAAIQLKDTASISNSYTLLSAIYESIDDIDRAIEYSQKALDFDTASGVRINTAQAYSNLAMLYMDNHNTKEALSLLYKALNIAINEFPSDRDKGVAQMYLGQCHHLMQRDDSAFIYFNDAKMAIADVSDPEVSIRFMESFAEACRATSRYDTALAYINKSIELSKQYVLLDHYALGLSIRSSILADLGRYHEAYDQYIVYTLLKDSLSGLAMQQTIADLQGKYDSDKKDERIAQQKRDNRLLTIGIVIAFILTALILFQYIQQRRASKTIQAQSDKLTLLMKELHHRVKNNLQIISSLLSLQSFRIKDDAASKAVRDGQQRIEAMSLIHQRLYTRDNITEINIKEFISDLIDSLQSAYGFGQDDITIKMDIDNELMNVDQAIPLSLIINELVTNAFKYAYEGNNAPELIVSLSKKGNNLQLVVADNGKGIDMQEWNNKDGSFGKELIQTFVKQLNGNINLTIDSGAKFTLIFPY